MDEDTSIGWLSLINIGYKNNLTIQVLTTIVLTFFFVLSCLS